MHLLIPKLGSSLESYVKCDKAKEVTSWSLTCSNFTESTKCSSSTWNANRENFSQRFFHTEKMMGGNEQKRTVQFSIHGSIPIGLEASRFGQCLRIHLRVRIGFEGCNGASDAQGKVKGSRLCIHIYIYYTSILWLYIYLFIVIIYNCDYIYINYIYIQSGNLLTNFRANSLVDMFFDNLLFAFLQRNESQKGTSRTICKYHAIIVILQDFMQV